MRYTDAVEFYDDSEQAVADALAITRQAVNLWKKGNVIPEGTAYKLQAITKGKLRVDPKLYEKRATA